MNLRFYKTNNGRMVALLILCLIISIYYNIGYSKENKKYEKYMSEKVGNIIGLMRSNLNSAKIILEKTNINNYISKEDINFLDSCLFSFIIGMQDLSYVNEITGNGKYKPLNISHFNTLYDHLSSLNHEIIDNGKLSYKIGANDILFFQLRFLTKDLCSIMGKDYTNWDYSITDSKWIDTYKKLDITSDKSYDISHSY